MLKIFRRLFGNKTNKTLALDGSLTKISKSLSKVGKHKYPCKNCIVRINCSKLCDQLESDEDVLLERMTKEKCCPDCGSKKFYEGPHGGAAVNVKCADCGHKFNLGLPLFVQRIGL